LNEIASGEFENSGAWLPLITSIGQQGFINEYIFDVSESEKAQLENLRADVADAATRNETIAPLKLAILASYLPLHSLPAQKHWRRSPGPANWRRCSNSRSPILAAKTRYGPRSSG
jgi:hypothetical protein